MKNNKANLDKICLQRDAIRKHGIGKPIEVIEAGNELIELYSNVDMIIVDDLGTEKISNWALEKLYTIIENRNENRLPIIITTRFNKQGLIERFSQSQDEQLVDAIISKLYQMCYGVTLKSMKKELV